MTTSPPPPRPVSVTVVPLLLAIVALLNLLIAVAMALTDGLPDPIVIFATNALGWYAVPLALFFAVGALIVAAAFVGWYVGVRNLSVRPGKFGVSRAVTIAVPALVGLVMPSVWWQVGKDSAPTGIDSATSGGHIFVAGAALLLPAGLVVWRWWRARNTLGAYPATGVVTAEHVNQIGSTTAVRSVRSVTNGMTKGLAASIAERIVEGLRFHSAYLPEDTVYQFRMPNGSLLTLTDELRGERRTLTVSLRSPLRQIQLFRGLIVRPKHLSPRGGWFAVPDPREERRVISGLTNNVQQAFAGQDDVPLEGAVIVDPALPWATVQP